MFLLIRQPLTKGEEKSMNLHSTMFLLIPMKNIQIPIELFYLHSTMFLLIHNNGAFGEGNGAIYIPQCFY